LGLRRLADFWWEAGFFHHLLAWDSVECVRRYVDRGRRRFLRPDSGGVYRIGARVYPFLLEVDLDRGHMRRVANRFRRYYRSRLSPELTELGEMPRLLVVCSTEGRARRVNGVVFGLAGEMKVPVLDMMVTTLDRIYFPGRFRLDGTVERLEGGGRGRPPRPRMWPGQREWRRVGEQLGSPTWCFEDLAPGRREAARRPLL